MEFWKEFLKYFFEIFCEIFTCLKLFVSIFLFLISAQVQLNGQSEKALTQKLLFLNKCPGRLINHLWYAYMGQGVREWTK